MFYLKYYYRVFYFFLLKTNNIIKAINIKTIWKTTKNMYRPAVNANVGERYAVLIILIPNVIPEIVGSLQNVINANMLHIIAIYIPITGINIDMPKILMQLLIMLSFLRIPIKNK
ncbi:hypothetical protein [Gilliamella apicola]|uniref:hypothetical protein n=1 Tax=Gilliamella apicola TaxID=1196095 RepID=UPI001552CADD|nr:hypothetical protein [Gilliamella apicola]